MPTIPKPGQSSKFRFLSAIGRGDVHNSGDSNRTRRPRPKRKKRVDGDRSCERTNPLQHSKAPNPPPTFVQPPHLSKTCPEDCFPEFQPQRLKFVRILSKFWNAIIFGQILTIFSQIPVSLTGTLRNNRQGLAVFECCRGSKSSRGRSSIVNKQKLPYLPPGR